MSPATQAAADSVAPLRIRTAVQSIPTTQPALQLGAPAPAIEATDAAKNPVSLQSLAGDPAEPILLQFGSLTEPIFRLHASAVDKLAQKYGGKIKCIILYTTEAHAADGPDPLDVNTVEASNIAAPTNLAERIKLAQQTFDRLKIKNQTLAIDAWNDTTFKRYGARPNMTFLIDAQGNLAAAYPWMDLKKVTAAIPEVLASKPVSPNNQGPIRTGIAEVALPQPGKEAQPFAAVAALLDNMELSDDQKLAILPPVADFYYDLRQLREKFQASLAPDKPANAAAELQDQVAKTKGDATKLKATLQQQLPKDDYTKVFNALNQGPSRRFFEE
jgi:hypothetical protein